MKPNAINETEMNEVYVAVSYFRPSAVELREIKTGSLRLISVGRFFYERIE